MAKDIDNPDKPDLDEEEEGAETDEEIDEEDDSTDSEEETDEEETDEDDEESEDDDSEDGSDKDGEDEDKDDPMAKFKGKTTEQVVEMYKNLEKSIEHKANSKAQELVKTMTKGKKKPEGADKSDDELEKELEQTDFSKMTPKAFAKWTLKQINQRAMNKAQEIFEQASNVKTAVSREIKEVSKAHPHLKENADYREIVIGLIEAAASNGKTMTLKEACEKADKAMSIQPKKKEDKPEDKKKPRTGVEKIQGTDGKENDTDEDRIKKSIIGGGNNKSDLGGLGI